MNKLNILFVGQMVPGARTFQRIRGIENLGHTVVVVPTNRPRATYEDRPTFADRIRYRLRRPADHGKANKKILDLTRNHIFDIAWMERAVEIKPATLKVLRDRMPDMKLIWYAEDDMMNPVHRSRYVDKNIPLFDLWVTTKSLNAMPGEVPSLGARRVTFVNNSYDPIIHKGEIVPEDLIEEYKCDVSFIGSCETPRYKSLLHLANNGIKVRVWGNGWGKVLNEHPNLKIQNRPVYNKNYALAVSASKINLCFLRKANRDLQTCRSMEIPAIGGFMIHERNTEICSLFKEDYEAVFFSNDDELFEKVWKWLSNCEGRKKIANQGRERALAGNNSHEDRIRYIFSQVLDGLENAGPC